MKKECSYCGNEYLARRSDALYCGTRCKNKASIDRRAERAGVAPRNYKEAIGKHKVEIEAEHLSLLLNSIPSIVPANSNTYKNIHEGTHDAVLLAEKDVTRDLSTQLSEYRMKLFYLEKDLSKKETEILELKSSLKILEKEDSQQQLGFLERLVENNPTIIPLCIEKLGPLLTKSSTQTNPHPSSSMNRRSTEETSIGKKKVMNKLRLKSEEISQEEEQEILNNVSKSLEKLNSLYPTYRTDDVLMLIVKAIEENKSLIDGFVFKDVQKESQ